MKENRIVISLRIPRPKKERLDSWIESWLDDHEFKPDRTQVILNAIDEYLDRRGAPPEKPTKGKSHGKRS